ncbi:MAG: sigma-70 family RNA polymerase sigma factor [Odoribacteraceae bacterium]|jgi:RNA polymerase sigma-70 factor (ECF subfamily)|nr:sigma-70 family RNA polymerase sigma factor [Odoribacteraceae bacterium]
MKEIFELEKMIRGYYATLYAVAIKFVVSPDIAQDITQEVIIRFWEKRHFYRESDSIEHLLFVSVKNEALNYLRNTRRAENRYKKLSYPESEDPVALNLLIEEETNQILVEAIRHLPEQSARIMRLLLSGYENKEIALIIGVSINTVKTLKYGAIRKLRTYLLDRDRRLHPGGNSLT